MFRIVFPILTYLLVTGSVTLLYRRAFPEKWPGWPRRIVLFNTALFFLGLIVWAVSGALELPTLRYPGILFSALGLVTPTIVFLSLPLWGGLLAVARVGEKTGLVDERRRAFLRRGAAVVPAAGALAGPAGTAAALASPTVREVDIPVKDLDERLAGLRVLQLTDVHLGTFIDNRQVQAVVDQVKDDPPDLVVLTGDISDDYEKLPAALEAVASLKPRLGSWACIGNHEIYRGREEAERLYAASEVTLLCDEGRLLDVDGAPLWICAADDPARLGADHRAFLEESVGRALAERPRGAASLVLSHRPEGFEAAARRGATLTLSGHTHGAQAAFFGRSWLEWVLPRSYLLGHYQAGESHLYTSAGLGHWFPFRLNCPCEAALVRWVRAV